MVLFGLRLFGDRSDGHFAPIAWRGTRHIPKRLFCNEFSHHPLHSSPPPSGEAFSFFVCVALSGNELRVRYDVFRASRVFDCPSVCHPKSVLRGVNSSWTIPLGSRLSHSGRAEPIRLELLHSQSHATFSVARLICLCRCTVHCPCQSHPPLPRRRRLDYVSRA